MPQYQDWLVTEEGRIATLTLNRPQTMNSLRAETLQELQQLTAALRRQKHIWAVIVQGQGKHFSSGMDLNVIKAAHQQTEQANREGLRSLQGCLDEFEALEKPTIARLHGFVIGGGLILALCCDFRIASRRTVFYLPEVRLGIPVLLGTQRIARTCGVAAAKEMVLLGERFRTEQALSWGLIHQVVEEEVLDRTVQRLAQKFLSLPPRTVGASKRIIDQGVHLTLRQSQDMEIDVQAELRDSPDAREALASYLEKRQPEFSGE